MTSDSESGAEDAAGTDSSGRVPLSDGDLVGKDDRLFTEIRTECLRLSQGDVVLALDLAGSMLLSRLSATSYGFGRGETDFMRVMLTMQHTD